MIVIMPSQDKKASKNRHAGDVCPNSPFRIFDTHKYFVLFYLSAFFIGYPDKEAKADQNGAAFWLSGQYASMSAVPMQQGWSLIGLGNAYRGAMNPMRISPALAVDEKSTTGIVLFQPGYTFDTKFLGATPYISVAIGPGVTNTALNLPGAQRGISQTLYGWSDLTPFASLSWNSGSNYIMTYITGNVPVGSYNQNRIANLGLGHGAIDWGAAYTYFNANTGWEFSVLAGVTYNWPNPYAQYQNGLDSHLDWGASRWINKNWQLGLAGYVYYQLTNDTGTGDIVGGNRSRVAAVGPQIGYQIQGKSASLYVNLRGYQELWAKNRTQGQSAFLTLAYSWNP